MSDLDTQIHSYFDANVERVTVDDVFAGRRLVEQLHRSRARWQILPKFVAAFGFAVTVFVVCGSLGLGLALHEPGDDAAAGTVSYGVGMGPPPSTGWGLLSIAAFLAVFAMVFIVLALRSASRSPRSRGRE
jgi:hypothetical protein